MGCTSLLAYRILGDGCPLDEEPDDGEGLPFWLTFIYTMFLQVYYFLAELWDFGFNYCSTALGLVAELAYALMSKRCAFFSTLRRGAKWVGRAVAFTLAVYTVQLFYTWLVQPLC